MVKRNCPTCDAPPENVVPVWEDPDGYKSGDEPDYLGCTECRVMRETNDKTEAT